MPLNPESLRGRRGRRPASRGLVAMAVAGLATLGLLAPASGAPLGQSEGAAAAACTVNTKLVPSCGVLWGAAPAAFDYSSRVDSTASFERKIGRNLDFYHAYKSNNQLFPSATEKQIAQGANGSPRLLLVNYRPGMDMTWKQMADGKGDARLDRLASHIKSTFTDRFFLAIWHEPEHFVNQNAGSGMTAVDYRNMVRHVILRLKSKGVSNAVFVQIYQGFPKYAAMSWWKNLYPGDDVIDWLGVDSYNSGKSSGYNSGGFDLMMNRKSGSWNGFYNWATSQHAGKPLMLAEWGVFANPSEPRRQGWFYDDVRQNLSQYPALKAMGYFNAAKLDKGTTRIDANSTSLDAYKRLTASLPRIDISNR